jgi:hypothetical protein
MISGCYTYELTPAAAAVPAMTWRQTKCRSNPFESDPPIFPPRATSSEKLRMKRGGKDECGATTPAAMFQAADRLGAWMKDQLLSRGDDQLI